MGADETVSDVFGSFDLPSTSRASRLALTLVMRAGDPRTAPSRHLLDEVDVIEFGRGPRETRRERGADGLRRLVVCVPDPVMSADHGRMLRAQGKWMLEDPSSRNGATIAGRSTRCGIVELGDVFELGHTIFLLDAAPVPASAPLDHALDRGAAGLLGSFHPDLIAAAEGIALVAPSGVPVLLHGETGTGKEVYAQTLHELSARPGPLVAVNCGAMSPSLLEAELFGHRRGAFSGANADRPGFVRAADRGTLFLDEIGELSPAGQVALLRVLQEREVVPVGDSTPIAVDIRVCAASHAPLLREVEAGRFRSDLYARLLGYELRLPPLRERPSDLGYLVASLLARLAPEHKVTFTPAAARALVAYDWPRNVRELERCLATALVLTRGRPIDVEHLPESVRAAALRGRIDTIEPPLVEHAAPTADAEPAAPGDEDLRRQLAAKLLEHQGNVSAVARALGKHREQVQRWIRRFGFDPELFRRGKRR